MAKGDIYLVLSLYDKDVVFLNQSSEPKRGKEALRKELAPFASAKASFEFIIRQVIQAGDIALTHTERKVSSPHPMSMYAIEVARRQSDGSWLCVIGDPFTLGRNFRQ